MKVDLAKLGKVLLAVSLLGIVVVVAIILAMSIWAHLFSDTYEMGAIKKTKWLITFLIVGLLLALIFYQLIMKQVVRFHKSRWTDFEPQLWNQDSSSSKPKKKDNS